MNSLRIEMDLSHTNVICCVIHLYLGCLTSFTQPSLDASHPFGAQIFLAKLENVVMMMRDAPTEESSLLWYPLLFSLFDLID